MIHMAYWSIEMSAQVTYRLWMDIQDIVGNAFLWLRRVRLWFWKRNLGHWDSVLVCAFCYVNGLNPAVLLEWLVLRRSCTVGDAKYEHICRLLDYMAKGHYARALYS